MLCGRRLQKRSSREQFSRCICSLLPVLPVLPESRTWGQGGWLYQAGTAVLRFPRPALLFSLAFALGVHDGGDHGVSQLVGGLQTRLLDARLPVDPEADLSAPPPPPRGKA